MLSLFDNILIVVTFREGEIYTAFFSSSLDLAIQCLCHELKLKVALCCFKKLWDLGFKEITTQTYNSLVTLLLSKGLPYKTFEIYEYMEASGCSLNAST